MCRLTHDLFLLTHKILFQLRGGKDSQTYSKKDDAEAFETTEFPYKVGSLGLLDLLLIFFVKDLPSPPNSKFRLQIFCGIWNFNLFHFSSRTGNFQLLSFLPPEKWDERKKGAGTLEERISIEMSICTFRKGRDYEMFVSSRFFPKGKKNEHFRCVTGRNGQIGANVTATLQGKESGSVLVKKV